MSGIDSITANIDSADRPPTASPRQYALVHTKGPVPRRSISKTSKKVQNVRIEIPDPVRERLPEASGSIWSSTRATKGTKEPTYAEEYGDPAAKGGKNKTATNAYKKAIATAKANSNTNSPQGLAANVAYAYLSTGNDLDEPSPFDKAMASPQKDKWDAAMQAVLECT
ncbi:MAG: hypothetical protein M1839_002426 [Geoglossum umbratile]|nr:MAG: hypothetical protein M1839_002426 [Geoglossum umbratile]